MVLFQESARAEVPPALAPIFERAATALLIGLVLVCCAGVFVGVGRSSFWLDEFFTARVVAAGPGGWDLILSDVHPPLYYLLLGGWAQVFGHTEAALRGFSAVCLVLSVLVLWAGTARSLSPSARLVTAAAAASSYVFFKFAQDARMYGLAVLFASLVLVAALNAMRAAREDGRTGRPLALLLGAGLLGAFTHFYLFVAVGLTLAYTLVFLRSWRDRLVVAFGGAAIFAMAAAFVWTVFSRPGGHVHQDLWFSASPGFLRETSLYFVRIASAPLLGAAAVLLALTSLALRRRSPAYGEASPHARDLGLLLFVGAGVWTVGIVSSVLFVPNFSGRNLVVTAPMVWFGLGWLYDFVRARAGETGRAAVLAATALLLLPGASLLRWTVHGTQEPWRESARYVAGLAGCQGAAVPVVANNRKGLYPYAYYLPAEAGLTPTPVPRATLASGGPAAWVADASARAREAGGCPVLLWSVHRASRAQLEAAAAHLQASPGFPRGRAVRIQEFAHVEPGLKGRTEITAFVLEVVPRSAAS
jgi:hypothetical protein